MHNFTKKPRTSVTKNKIFITLITMYIIVLLIVSSMACFFSYNQKKEELMSQINNSYLLLKQEYRNIVNNFWQIYMPFYDNQTTHDEIWDIYFSLEAGEDLSPFDKQNLKDALYSIMLRDNDIQWIVIYNNQGTSHYILYNDSSNLKLLPVDYPYLEELLASSQTMSVHGMRPFEGFSSIQNTFAICGNIPSRIGSGKLMVGYSSSNFQSICKNNCPEISSLNYVLTNNGEIIFDFSGIYDEDKIFLPTQAFSGTIAADNGENLLVCSQKCGLNTSLISYNISAAEVNRYCHSNTPLLIAIPFLFLIISLAGYIFMLQRIGKEVSTINEGLVEIGKNNLDYKLPLNFTQSGLPEIAASINQMTSRLQDNIHRAYYYELKQREAELSELQSKFNPHFLYNTLEMLRSRCQLNGDSATADLIFQLSAIFRGFISSKTFIPLSEELTFSKRYLSLFGARYENRINIHFDFDRELFQYGIIRNIFQPLIENYFVHGFDTSNEENYILFAGKSLDEYTMLLTVEDNGTGMTENEITQLNEKLNEPIQVSTESYGLKNLHQRLRLFYGNECGLHISKRPNEQKGISIQMTVKKLSCADYEKEKELHTF